MFQISLPGTFQNNIRIGCNNKTFQATFGLEPSTTLNTDEAASRGAALKCAILSPTFRVREFNIVDSVINEITINWSADSTGSNSGSLKIFEKKGLKKGIYWKRL